MGCGIKYNIRPKEYLIWYKKLKYGKVTIYIFLHIWGYEIKSSIMLSLFKENGKVNIFNLVMFELRDSDFENNEEKESIN